MIDSASLDPVRYQRSQSSTLSEKASAIINDTIVAMRERRVVIDPITLCDNLGADSVCGVGGKEYDAIPQQAVAGRMGGG